MPSECHLRLTENRSYRPNVTFFRKPMLCQNKQHALFGNGFWQFSSVLSRLRVTQFSECSNKSAQKHETLNNNINELCSSRSKCRTMFLQTKKPLKQKLMNVNINFYYCSINIYSTWMLATKTNGSVKCRAKWLVVVAFKRIVNESIQFEHRSIGWM